MDTKRTSTGRGPKESLDWACSELATLPGYLRTRTLDSFTKEQLEQALDILELRKDRIKSAIARKTT